MSLTGALCGEGGRQGGQGWGWTHATSSRTWERPRSRTGGKCLGKTRGVLGSHYRGHGNEREDGYEEMKAQRQKAARKSHQESRGAGDLQM